MDDRDDNYQHADVTYKIIGCGLAVFKELGSGFLEKVYENALTIELESAGFSVKKQVPLKVLYKGQVVGDYFADIIVDDIVLVELKTALEIVPVHQAQVLNYLKATGIEVGLVINFGPKMTFKRMVLSEPTGPSTNQ